MSFHLYESPVGGSEKGIFGRWDNERHGLHLLQAWNVHPIACRFLIERRRDMDQIDRLV